MEGQGDLAVSVRSDSESGNGGLRPRKPGQTSLNRT